MTTMFPSIMTFLHTSPLEEMKRITLAAVLMVLLLTSRAVEFQVSPESFENSGDFVTVRWAGIDSPSKLHWFGVYTPADSTDENFIGYVLLSSVPGWESGSGSLKFPLVNMRAPYQFRLFQGSLNSSRVDTEGNPLPSTNVRLAVSNNVVFKSFNEPTQVHLSLTSKPGEARVMFVTRDPLECFVIYGVEENSLDLTVGVESSTYGRDHMCDGPANTTLGWREPGYIHDGVLAKLHPNKRYYYQVGSKEGGWSDTYSFISPPEEGGETDALLFGDMGTSVPYKTYLWTQAQSENTLKWMQRDIDAFGNKPAFISHIGDISYARGYAWLWDEFFHRIQPVAARVPYIVCIGNHEYDWPLQHWKPDWALKIYGTDGGGECGVPYSLRFHMPGNSSFPTGTKAPATRNLYFSITFGVVHFVYFSTETNFLPGSDQYKFIVEDLESVDRKKVPFVVVLGHRPMYTSSIGGNEAPLRANMVEHLEPVFIKNKVDLVLWGHVHKYERTCGMKNFTCGDGPVHMVIGMGGADWQTSWQPRNDRPDLPIYPQPEWSLYRSDEFGYVKLHANKVLMSLSYIGNRDGEVHDYVEFKSGSARSSSTKAVQAVHIQGLGFLWGSLWFVCGCVLSAIVFTVYRKKQSGVNGEWSRIEMKPLE